MHRRVAVIAVSLLALSAGVTGASGELLHPKVKSGEVKVRAVTVLPAKVEITKSGVKGAESLLQEEDSFRAEIQDAVARAFSERGILVSNSPFANDGLQEDADVRYQLADVQARFDRLMENVNRKPKDIRKGRFSMGEEIADLVAPTDADAIAFIRASAVHNTGGKRVLSLLAGSYDGFVGRLVGAQVTLVHPVSGDVLALLGVRTERSLDKALRNEVRKLPGDTHARAKR